MTFSQDVTEVWTPDRWNNQQKHGNHHHLLNNEIWWFDEHRFDINTSQRHRFRQKNIHVFISPLRSASLRVSPAMASPPKKDLLPSDLGNEVSNISNVISNSGPNHPTPTQPPQRKKIDPRIITSCPFDSENEDQKRQAIHWVSLYLCQLPSWNADSKSQVVLEVVVSRTADQSVNYYPGSFP